MELHEVNATDEVTPDMVLGRRTCNCDTCISVLNEYVALKDPEFLERVRIKASLLKGMRAPKNPLL